VTSSAPVRQLTELARQVGQQLGGPDGVLVFDPSAFPKKGDASVGVQRQWCGRLGKIDNCQVGIYLAYGSRSEHALVDVRLYLPREWANDKERRKRAGVPRAVRFRTRHELALETLDERGPLLPHAWVAGDDELGRCSWFRQQLRQRRNRSRAEGDKRPAGARPRLWPCLLSLVEWQGDGAPAGPEGGHRGSRSGRETSIADLG